VSRSRSEFSLCGGVSIGVPDPQLRARIDYFDDKNQRLLANKREYATDYE
jgi:hypothetical protein